MSLSLLVCPRVVVGGHTGVALDGVDSLAAAGGCSRSLDPESEADGESGQPALDVEEEEGRLYHHCLSLGHWWSVDVCPVFGNQLPFIVY